MPKKHKEPKEPKAPKVSRSDTPRSVGEADLRLGELIRLRRTEIKMSQSELGDALGVSFQQVQKYEKGVNRVGAARLQSIAIALKVPMVWFYQTASKDEREVNSLLFQDSRFSLRLLRAYNAIPNEAVQRSVVALLEKIAGTTGT